MEPGQENPADEQSEEGAAEAEVGEGGPGYAGDGVADLFCPSCGFGADSAHPTTTPSDPTVPANAGDGMVEGDICPNCTKATLMSGAAPGQPV
jgi:ribosomal protein S27AE